MDLSIIILTYNVKNLLRECLNSLKESIDKSELLTEVFVVDNGNDGTKNLIKNNFEWVQYIPNPANDGFSKGNNLALKKAGGDYLLLLNPDTKLQSDTLTKIFNFMCVNTETGISTCRVELPDGNLDGACHRGFPTPWNSLCRFIHLSKKFPTSRIFNGYNLGYLNVDEIHEVDCVTGAFAFVRRKAIYGDEQHEEVGFLDEDYWANGEDIDWCYRIKNAGWKIMYVPTTKITHYKGASSGTQESTRNITTATRETKERWINAFYDAMPIFYNKHYKHKYPFFIKFLILFGIEIKRRIALKKLLGKEK